MEQGCGSQYLPSTLPHPATPTDRHKAGEEVKDHNLDTWALGLPPSFLIGFLNCELKVKCCYQGEDHGYGSRVIGPGGTKPRSLMWHTSHHSPGEYDLHLGHGMTVWERLLMGLLAVQM